MENNKNMITDGNEKKSFVVQNPLDQRMSYMKVVNNNIRNLFSEEMYEKIQNDKLFTKIVFALDDSIQKYNETYAYLKEFSKEVKEILNTDSILETVGFSKINKEFIQKEYQGFLKKYKKGGLQSITFQEKNGADAINLNGDMTRFLKDRPITDDTKSLILYLVLYAIMIDECSQKEEKKDSNIKKYTII